MKILCLADEENKAYWDYFRKEKLADIDLILSCGDLKADYLTFLVTMGHAPLFYIHGNHDEGYRTRPPEGCDCIDDHIVVYNGVRILGLGGCRRYHPGAHQYTEREMHRRIQKLSWKLKRLGGVDIVVTHAPPAGLGDAEDPAHWGFEALVKLLDEYHPAYLVHGHVHTSYDHRLPREIQYQDTKILNACQRYVFEIPDREIPLKQMYQVIYKTRRPAESHTSMILR